MKTLDCAQGTPEWHEARREHYRTASSASKMMGARGRRDDLIAQVVTGIEEEHDEATLARFARGHEIEAMARPLAEEIIEETLYPVTAISDDGYLLGSFDGLTISETKAWECKSWNEKKVSVMRAGSAQDSLDSIPVEDRYQVKQLLALMGPYSKVLYMVTDGTPQRCEYVWVYATGNEDREMRANWAQFDVDVEAYRGRGDVIPAYTPAPVATAHEYLPAITIQAMGTLTVRDNLSQFGDALTAYLERMPRQPKTDQEFADLEDAVKRLKLAEEALDAAESGALAQASDIDDMRRQVEHWRGLAKSSRLMFEKLVKTEKEARRAALVMKAHEEMRQHRDALNKRIGGAWMPITPHNFGEVVKGLKSIKSMEDKLNTAVAHAKVADDALANTIQANHKAMMDTGRAMLFNDFDRVCQKSTEDFTNLLASRIQADEARLQEARDQAIKAESARLLAEAEAKARAEAQAQAQAQGAKAREAATHQVVMPAVNEAVDPHAVVVNAESVIAAFMATHQWKKGEEGRVRAILVEFVKFQAGHGMKKAA